MERFIEDLDFAVFVAFLFKIQYGEIYRYYF